MLRFILKNKIHNTYSQLKTERLYTIDLKVPEIESLLINGGSGEAGYDVTELVGIEVIIKEEDDE